MSTPTVRVATPTVPGLRDTPQATDAPADNTSVFGEDVHVQPDAPQGFDPELAKWGTPVSEYTSGICLGIYGRGGKTTLIGSAADSIEHGGPVLLYNAAANPHVLRSRGSDVVVKDITRFDQLEAERQKVIRAAGSFPFKTVAFDVCSEMHAMLLRDLYGAAAEVSWQDHSKATALFKQFVRNWRDLSQHPKLQLNVIFSFWDAPEKRKIRGVETDIMDLSLAKTLQADLPGMVPFVGYLYVDGPQDDSPRCLDFRNLQMQQVSKWNLDPKDDRTNGIPKLQWNPSLGSIIDAYWGVPWPTAKHTKPGAKPGA